MDFVYGLISGPLILPLMNSFLFKSKKKTRSSLICILYTIYISRYILCNVYTIHIIPWCWCWLLLLASYKKAGKPSSHSYNVKVVNDLTNEDHLSFIGKLPVCEEDCILSEWAEWGPCSESCGSDGQQVSFLFTINEYLITPQK